MSRISTRRTKSAGVVPGFGHPSSRGALLTGILSHVPRCSSGVLSDKVPCSAKTDGMQQMLLTLLNMRMSAQHAAVPDAAASALAVTPASESHAALRCDANGCSCQLALRRQHGSDAPVQLYTRLVQCYPCHCWYLSNPGPISPSSMHIALSIRSYGQAMLLFVEYEAAKRKQGLFWFNSL